MQVTYLPAAMMAWLSLHAVGNPVPYIEAKPEDASVDANADDIGMPVYIGAGNTPIVT